MSEVFMDALAVRQNPDEAHYDRYNQSRIVPSVIHTIILPLGLAIASPIAGIAYFLFAVAAYFTIFPEKSGYVRMIAYTAAAIIGWISLFGFIALIGAAS